MSQWIAAITRGHNGGICLLKDGKIVFAIEEERLRRQKVKTLEQLPQHRRA